MNNTTVEDSESPNDIELSDDTFGKNYGYGIGFSLGILILLSVMAYASYLCIRSRSRNNSNVPNNPSSSSHDSSTLVDIQQGIDEEILRNYPKLLYSQAKVHYHREDNNGCSICLGDYKDNDMLRWNLIIAGFINGTMIIEWVIRCPCVRCNGINLVSEEDVKEHLYRKGFHEDFLRLHRIHGDVAQNNFVVGESSRSAGHNEYQDTRMTEMVHDAFGMQHGVEFRKNVEDVPNSEAGNFYKELHAASHPLSSEDSIPTPMHVGPLHVSTPAHSAPMIVPPPAQYYRTTADPSRHRPSSIPSCSNHAISHSDSAGSIGLSNLQLGGTPSSALDSPMPVHPPSLTRHPGDIDDSRRIYLVPVVRGREYALLGTSTATEPASKKFQNLTGIECLKNLSAEYQLLSEKGNKAQASSKGGSLHIAGARSTLAVIKKMEKVKGRKIPHYELYEETHVMEKKNPNDEDVWVEVRAKAVHRQKKTEKETTSQFKKQQQQLSSFIRTAEVIPPYSGDAVWAINGLGPLDDFSTDDDMEDEDEFDDDEF
ncbi:putative dnaJ protein -like protein isoform 1 [Capsicum annuum]|nr:putative dnaJ protein -like protein isoform 1 [Capsicum annuum]